jgi:hypothetical protein
MENISQNIENSGYEKNKVRFIALNLFIIFLSVYLLSSSDPFIYKNYDVWQLRIELVKSIVERHDLTITADIGTRGVRGEVYSGSGIGSAVLAVPFYIGAKIIGVSPENAIAIMHPLFGAATVVIIFLFSISLNYSRRASLLVAVFYGLGTMAWPMGKQPFDNVIETFFVLLAVYLIYLYSVHGKIPHLLCSAFSLGFAFITRYTSVLVVAPLIIFIILYYSKQSALKQNMRHIARDVLLFSLVFLPFFCFVLWYNYYRFGSLFETGYSLISERTGVDFFSGTSILTGLSGLLISPGKGFFYYSPVAILFFFSLKAFFKRHLYLGITFIFIIISYLGFLSRVNFWHGDWAWGPRYIFVLTPFFIIPIAEFIESNIWKKKIFLRVLVYSIFAISIVIQIAAVSVDYRKYFYNLSVEENVKFSAVKGDGVQSIHEPPAEIYFDWHKSPILAQFRFINEIAKGIKNYTYTSSPADATDDEKIKINPIMNVFDFWWLYKYFIDGEYSGFLVATMLLLLAIYSGIRLYKLSR